MGKAKRINKEEMKIRWLDSRGGRTVDDIQQEDGKEFVMMGDGKGGEKRIYLPNHKKMKYDLITYNKSHGDK